MLPVHTLPLRVDQRVCGSLLDWRDLRPGGDALEGGRVESGRWVGCEGSGVGVVCFGGRGVERTVGEWIWNGGCEGAWLRVEAIGDGDERWMINNGR